ncbi:MAG: hypothetical protein PUC50_07070 [Bacteroidales bacterium]|nr:hypothetical protein [Bacteroidales bacterium]
MTKRYILILILGIILIPLIIFLNGCYIFKYLLLLDSFILVCVVINKLLCSKRDLYYILYIPICVVYFVLFNDILHKEVLEKNPNHYKVIASITKFAHPQALYRIYYYYKEGEKVHNFYKYVSEDEYKLRKKGSNKHIIVENNRGQITVDWNPSSTDLYKYSKPVYYVNNKEVGNDYYYYAKLCPDIAINNYGLKQVTKAIENSDTILYYCNLNPTIDSVAHRLADTLQTQANRNIVGDEYGFLFHDGIYSKEQVFEEIPLAKEYYLKYYKDDNQNPK